jgi:hypothetical protein
MTTLTNYNQNSLFAFISLKPKMTEREREVYNSARMYNRPFTDKDIANFMGWPINRITGRRGGLVKKGLVRLVRDDYFQDGSKVNLWEVGEII